MFYFRKLLKKCVIFCIFNLQVFKIPYIMIAGATKWVIVGVKGGARGKRE